MTSGDLFGRALQFPMSSTVEWRALYVFLYHYSNGWTFFIKKFSSLKQEISKIGSDSMPPLYFVMAMKSLQILELLWNKLPERQRDRKGLFETKAGTQKFQIPGHLLEGTNSRTAPFRLCVDVWKQRNEHQKACSCLCFWHDILRATLCLKYCPTPGLQCLHAGRTPSYTWGSHSNDNFSCCISNPFPSKHNCRGGANALI